MGTLRGKIEEAGGGFGGSAEGSVVSRREERHARLERRVKNLVKREGSDARANMLDILVAPEVSQLPIGWLNSQTLTNVDSKSQTLDTSHLPMGLLNTRAPWNMDCIVVTLDTSQALMSPLNAKFLWNILVMLVTLDVFHLLTSIWLPVMCTKRSNMLVTWETSQYGGSVHPAYPHLGLDATSA